MLLPTLLVDHPPSVLLLAEALRVLAPALVFLAKALRVLPALLVLLPAAGGLGVASLGLLLTEPDLVLASQVFGAAALGLRVPRPVLRLLALGVHLLERRAVGLGLLPGLGLELRVAVGLILLLPPGLLELPLAGVVLPRLHFGADLLVLALLRLVPSLRLLLLPQLRLLELGPLEGVERLPRQPHLVGLAGLGQGRKGREKPKG